MSSNLERAITAIRRADLQASAGSGYLDPRCLLLVVALYLVAMLSVPVASLGMLLWFAIVPPLAAPLLGLSFGSIFLKSLAAVPFALFIGIFNPIYDKSVAFMVMGHAVSRGWLEFLSIMLRSVLSLQAVLILVDSIGFVGMCRSMERIGVPRFLTTQLLLVFRYIGVMLEEVLVMKRAREARGAGAKSMKLKAWGEFVGQLFLRSVERSRRVYHAMLARGFNGNFPVFTTRPARWQMRDTLTLTASIALFALLRLTNISALLHF